MCKNPGKAHSWVDLILKICVSAIILCLLNEWLSFVQDIVWGVAKGGYEVSQPVLIALVSGTSVNLIGLLAIMARYLFYKRIPIKKE